MVQEALKACPHCGGNLQRPTLAATTLVYNGHTWMFTPDQAAVLACLIENMPRGATHDQLAMAVWGGRDEPENSHDVIKVHVCRIRRNLKRLGLAIATMWGTGYRLDVL